MTKLSKRRLTLRIRLVCFLALFVVVLAALPSFGQSAPSDPQGSPSSTPADTSATPTKPAEPQPLPMPSMTGPLQTAPPHEFEGGKLAVTGILSGIGWTEGNHISGDPSSHYDVSNAQVFIQKTTGWWQFYLQGGAYNLPAIGVPFLSTSDTVKNIYGPFPQGYLKLVKGNFNVEVGALPTLIGAEYTFSFENMNIERGLLWNQENAVNRVTKSSAHHSAGMMAFTPTAILGSRDRWPTHSTPRTPWRSWAWEMLVHTRRTRLRHLYISTTLRFTT